MLKLIKLEWKKNNIGKATYIFWINKTEAKKLRGLTFNIKCKVTINEDGSIKILGYEKEQPYTVTKSLKKYLKTFKGRQGGFGRWKS